ncbi:MAG: hypothetical protein ACO3K7_06755 [Candidatus Marinamargulisbacteria bacterium]
MNIGRYFKMNTQYRSLCDVNDSRPSLATQILQHRMIYLNQYLQIKSMKPIC